MPSLFYIFWSYPRADVDTGEYSLKLGAFRVALATRVGGQLVNSETYKTGAVLWLPEGVPAFCDWYQMNSSAILDTLNDYALESEVKPYHDAIAVLYGGGAGSLYDWKLGEFAPAKVAFTHWFAKPKGMTYEALYEALKDILPPAEKVTSLLLRRRMVLGPSPEFCVASEALIEFPRPFESYAIQMK
jgi:hypothetical protein